jgi:hypothetical protein
MPETIRPRRGFDWQRVKWGAPDAPRTEHCSYCGDKLPRDDDAFVPLTMWTSDGWCAEFCDHCQAAWWGIEAFDDPAEPRDEPEVVAANRAVGDRSHLRRRRKG